MNRQGWARERDRAPERLPLLNRGSHRRPDDGACVMEYVSVLSGERFSDHPRCTHPALAALARLVNDSIGDDAVRSRLALLAPDLVGAGRGDLRGGDAVVASCLSAAAAAGGLSPGPLQRLAAARERLQRLDAGDRWTRTWVHCRRVWYSPCAGVASAFHEAASPLRELPPGERDARLCELLRAAVVAVRRADGRTPAGSLGRRGAQTS